MPVGGELGDELSGLEVLVDLEAGPGVDGGILLLGVGEVGGFPVGELLALADLLLEDDGVDLLQAHVGDGILLDEFLQLGEAGGVEGGVEAHELVEVICGREADFDDGCVLQELPQGCGQAGLVEAEEEGVGLGRELEQGDAVPLAALEAGPGLGVKADYRRGAQGGDGALDL